MPLRIRIDRDKASIFLASNSIPIFVAPDRAGRLVMAESADPAARAVAHFVVEGDPQGRFALRHGEHYVSANSDGVLVCNRSGVLDWELFRVGAASKP